MSIPKGKWRAAVAEMMAFLETSGLPVYLINDLKTEIGPDGEDRYQPPGEEQYFTVDLTGGSNRTDFDTHYTLAQCVVTCWSKNAGTTWDMVEWAADEAEKDQALEWEPLSFADISTPPFTGVAVTFSRIG